jgi:hypothetical protein
MPERDLTPEETQRVQELRKALESEFELNQNRPTTSIKDIVDLKDDALEALRYILRHGTKDDLKAKVSMWVYDRCISSEDSKSENELLDLLRNMPNSTEETASQAT